MFGINDMPFGSPTIRTLNAVLKATGLKFGVSAH